MPNEIPQEIMEILIETPGIDLDCSSVRCKCSGLYECTNLKGMADKLYHLRDREVEEIISAAIRRSEIAIDRLNEKDQRIKELEELVTFLRSVKSTNE